MEVPTGSRGSAHTRTHTCMHTLMQTHTCTHTHFPKQRELPGLQDPVQSGLGRAGLIRLRCRLQMGLAYTAGGIRQLTPLASLPGGARQPLWSQSLGTSLLEKHLETWAMPPMEGSGPWSRLRPSHFIAERWRPWKKDMPKVIQEVS